MKPTLAILILATSLHAGDNWSALSQLESGDRDNATGRAHEVSRYQMTPAVWRSATSLPLSAATNRDVAWSVASRVQGARVVAFARREGRMPTAGEWSLLWHCPARVLHANAEEKLYEQRFLNLLSEPRTALVNNAGGLLCQTAGLPIARGDRSDSKIISK